MTNYEMVAEFHQAFNVNAPDEPTALAWDRLQLRKKLITEEWQEWIDGLLSEDFVEQVDALLDLLYVTYGTLVEMGVNADKGFAEVHRSNMSKLDENSDPIYREDGKVLKSALFTPPDLESVIYGND